MIKNISKNGLAFSEEVVIKFGWVNERQVVFFCIAIGRDPTGLILAIVNNEVSISHFLIENPKS